MATLTVTAVAEPANDPPRVLVTVTDAGTPLVPSVTVLRNGSDGSQIVRTPDGNPLVINSVSHIGTVYDYEAGFGTAYTYTTVETPVTASSTTTLDVSLDWLIHPGIPALSIPYTRELESNRTREHAANQGVFLVQGRATPVVVTDRRRKAPTGELVVITQSSAELEALRALCADMTPLLMNIPAARQQGVASAYIAVGVVTEDRISDTLSEPVYVSRLPYQVVDRPVGGSRAEYTYADLLANYSFYATVRSTFATYQDVLSG